MTNSTRYEGFGWTLEAAVLDAHAKVPNRQEGELELGMSRVAEIKLQRNGFLQSISFKAIVEVDLDAGSWPEPPRLTA